VLHYALNTVALEIKLTRALLGVGGARIKFLYSQLIKLGGVFVAQCGKLADRVKIGEGSKPIDSYAGPGSHRERRGNKRGTKEVCSLTLES
jgi:hypothetical protein